MASSIIINLLTFDKAQDFPLPEDSNLVVRINKIGLGNDYQLVTANLTNKRPKGKSELDYVIFQAYLEVVDQDSNPIFIAENICRSVLNEEEFYYRKRPIFGRGRGCCHVGFLDENCFQSIYTFIPEYDSVGRSVYKGFEKLHFLMSFMAKPANKFETIKRLEKLRDAYATWIEDTWLKTR